MSRNANMRWEYSMIEWYSSGGSHRPAEHFGHPVHPSPDPVARTRPPATMRRYVMATAATAARRSPLSEVSTRSGKPGPGPRGGERTPPRLDIRRTVCPAPVDSSLRDTEGSDGGGEAGAEAKQRCDEPGPFTGDQEKAGRVHDIAAQPGAPWVAAI